jgi:hypothetical protein
LLSLAFYYSLQSEIYEISDWKIELYAGKNLMSGCYLFAKGGSTNSKYRL